MDYPRFNEPEKIIINTDMLVAPGVNNEKIDLEKGPNIKPLPQFDPLPDSLQLPVLLKVGDNVSTDDILAAGTRVLPFRSNIPEISKFVFEQIDETYYKRAMKHQEEGSLIVGGSNYGQGSSREHAAIAPRYLGVKIIIVKSFARIHWQNLINFGILPLTFLNPDDFVKINQDDVISVSDISSVIRNGTKVSLLNETKNKTYETEHALSERQVEIILKGSLINLVRNGTELHNNKTS